MKYGLKTFLPAALFALLFLPWGGVQVASAAPPPLDMSRGAGAEPVFVNDFPGDFTDHGAKDGKCVETCSIQGDYYDDEMEGEEQYEEEYDDGGEEYQDEAEEQYDDEYGDEDFQEEVYPEDHPEEQHENGWRMEESM